MKTTTRTTPSPSTTLARTTTIAGGETSQPAAASVSSHTSSMAATTSSAQPTTSSSPSALPVTTGAGTPAPVHKLEVSTTLEGMTSALFDSGAQETFKSEVAALVPDTTADDVTITGTEEVSRRRQLQASGLKVDYEIAGFASIEVVAAAASMIEAKKEVLMANLKADDRFSELTGVSNEFDNLDIQLPSTTPSNSAGAVDALSPALLWIPCAAVCIGKFS
mmetsp:Transcript_49917/g.99649  ORF Transcript_49917/g.99649 Transcript_49917/m.99649 type:complete len:221 (+) Transcript_49917:1-663(+)